MLRPPLACLLALSTTACVGHEPPPALPPVDWQGPPVRLEPRPDGGADLLLTAPTLGHRLELDRIEDAGDTAEVYCRLVTPARDAMVGQAVTELRVPVAAERLPAGAERIRLWIATWQDGVQYIRAPQPVLAATAQR